MPSFTVVAANLLQPASAGGSSATSAPSHSSESFSSHLQAATGKQQARSQNSGKTNEEINDSQAQVSSGERSEAPASAPNEKISSNRDSNESKSTTANPETPQGGENQPSATQNAEASQVASQPLLEERLYNAINSERSGKESFAGKMLAAITNPQTGSNTELNPAIAASKGLEIAGQVSPDDQMLPLQGQPGFEQNGKLIQADMFQRATGLEQTVASSETQAVQGNLESGRQSIAGTTIVFNSNDGSITITPQENQLSVGSTVTTGQAAEATQEEINGPLLVQNKYGQVITIEQSKEATLSPLGASSVAGQRFLYQETNNLDITGRYIHSHLPNEAVAKVATHADNAAMNSDQSQSGLFGGGDQDIHSALTGNQTGGMQESASQSPGTSPLSFSYQMNNVQTGTNGVFTTSTEGTSYQLGSGTLVPDTTVVDQISAHLSVNKRLETGSINLKLHPQELGELRMEIKIEHDNVKAHIVAQSPHAQEMIDRHLPRLREALEQQGLHLHEIEVTVADNDNAAGERFKNNDTWQQSQQSVHRSNLQTDFTLEQDEDGVEADELNDTFKAIA